jgi:potassium-transporting ATPase A subunit
VICDAKDDRGQGRPQMPFEESKPVTAGTLSTDTPLFAGLMIVTILMVGALSYLPVWRSVPSSSSSDFGSRRGPAGHASTLKNPRPSRTRRD